MCSTKKYHQDIYSQPLRGVPGALNFFHEEIYDREAILNKLPLYILLFNFFFIQDWEG